MTMTTSTELSEAQRAIVSRLASIAEARSALDLEEKTLKAELRSSLDFGQWTVAGTPVLSVAPNRRFSPEKAAEILPPDLLALCRVEKVDAATAKKILPPALYSACADTVGEPVLRLL